MPYAAILCIKDSKAQRIADLWNALADNDISDEQKRFNSDPHVTLAVFDGEEAFKTISAKLAMLANHWQSLQVSLEVIHPSPPNALLVTLNESAELRRYQSEIFATLPPAGDIPDHYQPEKFIGGHVTLARDLNEETLPAAFAAVLEIWAPFEAMLDRAAIIQFYPESGYKTPTREAWSRQLSTSGVA